MHAAAIFVSQFHGPEADKFTKSTIPVLGHPPWGAYDVRRGAKSCVASTPTWTLQIISSVEVAGGCQGCHHAMGAMCSRADTAVITCRCVMSA